MTAEERMAYFQGEKRRNNVRNTKSQERNHRTFLLKFRFFVAVLILIAFLSLDYTGFKVQGIGSERIIEEVVTDFSVEDFQQFYKRFVPIR